MLCTILQFCHGLMNVLFFLSGEESESSDYDIAAQSSGEELSEPGSDPDFSCGESDLMETSEPEKTTRRLTRNLRKSLLDGSLVRFALT